MNTFVRYGGKDKRDLAVFVPQQKSSRDHRDFVFESTGKIIYDPTRGKMKSNTEWWCVVNCDPGITDYYRHLVSKKFGFKIDPPAWGAHISVVRGERAVMEKKDLWRKYHGKVIKFKYSYLIGNNSEFWWINIDCPFLHEIRKELGLVSTWGFHMTVGRIDEQATTSTNQKK